MLANVLRTLEMKRDYLGDGRKLVYNIIIALSHIGRKFVDWIHLAQ
jgi:hypothetical protein